MDLLGDMPTIQCSYEEAFRFYNALGRGFEYRKAVADYIHITNAPYRKSILDYCKRRQGEWAHDEKIEEAKMAKNLSDNMRIHRVRWEEALDKNREKYGK